MNKENVRIKSLSKLKDWNKNPTEEKPIVLAWFMQWFFEDVLMKNKKTLATDAYNTMVEFAMKCEKFTKEQATERTNVSLGYYAGYSSEWYKKLDEYFPEIKHPVFGKDYHST